MRFVRLSLGHFSEPAAVEAVNPARVSKPCGSPHDVVELVIAGAARRVVPRLHACVDKLLLSGSLVIDEERHECAQQRVARPCMAAIREILVGGKAQASLVKSQ